MKKGMIYIEAIVCVLIITILIVAVSKISLDTSKILENNKKRGEAFDILRGTVEMCRVSNLHNIKKVELNINDVGEVEEYLSFGKVPTPLNKEYKLIINRNYYENLNMYLVEAEITSNNNKFKKIDMISKGIGETL